MKVSGFFQQIIKVINDMDVPDEEFINFDNAESQEIKDGIVVGDTKYSVINSILELIKIFYDYIKLVKYFDSITSQAAVNLTNLLKTFNQISSEQILGSEAFRSGILDKGITHKHLAVTTQSLDFILAEIPYLQEQILCRVTNTDKQEIIKHEFDLVQDSLNTHKSSILNKLTMMLSDVVKKSMRSEKPETYKTKYDSSKKPGPSSYIVQIVKSMINLNKVISSLLNEE